MNLKSINSLYILILLLLIRQIGQSQNKPNAVTVPVSAVSESMPFAYKNDTKVNFVRAYVPNKPFTDPVGINMNSPAADVMISTSYTDGLGREIQKVVRKGSPQQKDMIGLNLYDEFGREVKELLPYTAASATDGNFKQNAFYEDSVFNKAMFNGEQIYYGKNTFDNSPLNKVIKVTAPGNSWAGAGRGVSVLERSNAIADSVRKWAIQGASVDAIPASSGFYVSNQLLVQETTDENNNKIVKFIDQRGRVVLSKKKASNTSATGHYGWLSTYFIYDELNNLRYIVPPNAVEVLRANGWNLSDAGLRKELCFRYSYDARRRLVVHGVPGGGIKEKVYDTRSRLVFVRDSSLKALNKWQVIFYDELDRPTMTALYNSSATREVLESNMSAITGSAQNISYTIPGVANLVVANYDGRNRYEATKSINIEDGFDSGTGAEFIAEINENLNGGTVSVTATNPLPNIPASELTPMSYTFYDDYSYAGAQPAVADDFSKPVPPTGSYPDSIVKSSMTYGLITGTKVRVIGTDDWLTTTVYYNDKGRPIQTIADNITKGRDVVTRLYDFSGRELSTYQRHTNLRSGVTPASTFLTTLSYDHSGRLTSLKKKLNDNVALERTVGEYAYNELGRLRRKRLGIQPSGGVMDSLIFDYNIRGWLRGINKDYVVTSGSSSNKFGQELNYDYGFDTVQYNGNIAGVKWKGWNDKTPRAYGYAFDRVNQLSRADFVQQNTNGAAWTQDKVDFSVRGVSYDANGNIRSMTQKGLKGGAISTVDQLTYTYQSNSNKLEGVVDSVNDVNSTLGDFKEVNGSNSNDYSYDGNGNLTKDLNRNISQITYNHLNKPEKITIKGKGSIQYVYDASGNRLRKIVSDSTVSPVKVTTTDYINNFVYRNDSLQFVAYEEGRVRAIYKASAPITYCYDYFIRDHLGSIRTVLTEQTEFTMYAATMETERAATESALFSNVEETRSVKPVAYPQDNTTSKNEFVAKLNAKVGGKKIGPSLVLRVMAGDTVQIGAKAFYKSQGPKDNGRIALAEDMVADLLHAFEGGIGGKTVHGANQTGQGLPFNTEFYNNDYQHLKEKSLDQNKTDKPRAYLNFVLFDDQFNLVESNSGVRQVQGDPDELQALGVDKMPIEKSGFLYVYTSNESEQDVFFDNVVLSVAAGPVLEETHYYPYGLEMSGISYNAPLKLKNVYRFNSGSELMDDLDINFYNTFYRGYDPQIGRFGGIDIAASKFNAYSPYSYALNNPAFYNDPLGDESIPSSITEIIDNLNNTQHGGYWSSGTGYSEFSSEADAFAEGANIMNQSNAWGSYDFANSYGDAAAAFNSSDYAANHSSFVPLTMTFLPGVNVVAYDQLSYAKAGVEILSQVQTALTTGTLGGIMDAIDNTEDVLSFSRDVTEGFVVGSQMLANKAAGKAVTEELVTDVLNKVPIGRVVGKVAPIVDIAMDIRKGDNWKAAIKAGWTFVEGPIAATGPWGLGVVVVVNVTMGAADVFGWW